MIRLTREVRFSLTPPTGNRPVTNSWGGWPSASSLAAWMVFRCTLAGHVEKTSGYLCNIKLIDDVLRRKVVEPARRRIPDWTHETLLHFAVEQIAGEFPDHCHVESLQLGVTPTLEYTLHTKDETMIELTQQFEFSASHRLHNPELSDDENRELFGKCNNPHGHGHNYLLSVTVQGEPDDKTGTLLSLEDFETLVGAHVIDRFDHRYLNIELPEFAEQNPSVENIAVVVWDLLQAPVESMPGSAALGRVRVYETPKTWAEYAGPPSA